MKLAISFLLLLVLSSATAETIGTLMFLDKDKATNKVCSSSEDTAIQGALSSVAKKMNKSSGLRRNLIDCTSICSQFPSVAYCYYFVPQCAARRELQVIDQSSHPQRQAKCKQQSKRIERLVTSKKFLDGFSKDCKYLLEQTMEFVCFVDEY